MTCLYIYTYYILTHVYMYIYIYTVHHFWNIPIINGLGFTSPVFDHATAVFSSTFPDQTRNKFRLYPANQSRNQSIKQPINIHYI